MPLYSQSPVSLVVKGTPEFRRNTTTLADDAELIVPLGDNKIYNFRGMIFYDTSPTADFKFKFVFGNGGSGQRLFKYSILPGATALSNIAVTQAFELTTFSLTGTGSTGGYIYFEGWLQSPFGTVSSLKFQWAQNSLDNTVDTQVNSSSYIEYWIAKDL